MGKINMGETLKKVGDVAKKAVDVAQVKAGELGTVAKQGTEKLTDYVKNAAEKKKADNAAKAVEKKAAAEEAAMEAEKITAISPMNAARIFYCMIASDGKINEEETEMFNLIGKEIDPKFDVHRDKIIEKFNHQLEKAIDQEDYYGTVQDGVEEALTVKQESDCGYISPELLIWDMLTIAYSDREYHDAERKLLKYVVRKLDIPKDIFLEMESSLLTVKDIEKELRWIKQTNRPYLEIEKNIKELEKRKEDILRAIRALIIL